MIERSFDAMGTRIDVWCEQGRAEDGVRELFEQVEAICSRFRPESEISVLNSTRHTIQEVTPLLGEVLFAAEHARELTGGLVDIGVGQSVNDWGYSRTFSEVTDLDVAPVGAKRPSWSMDGRTLRRRSGTVLDLGGIAKGWTCDRAVERGLGVVVSAGGDLRSAHDRTTVSVLDDQGSVVAKVGVGVGALATSSTSKRRWRVAGREVAHIVDPRTMAPVESPVTSATVIAATALEAEAGAKAVLLRGEDGLAWADAQDWIRGAVVIWHDGSVYATSSTEIAA